MTRPTEPDPRVHDLIAQPWWFDDAETEFFMLRDAPKPQTLNRFRRVLRTFAERAVALDRQRLANFDVADVVAAAQKTSRFATYLAEDDELAIRQLADAEWAAAIVHEIAPMIVAAYVANYGKPQV